ncbi:ankyrin repeat domain-containing protein [Novosphingobium sp. H3SJ31-1]|uniref:Ankyrin repeat domain-containing protein n=2 Tax=Novosphingobium album (ex Liu et al. 2023) TaxID=3031130 RepID=A0ABT5WSY0_9SPHN|nr:ankyrin repeat domain-containing protein [Novosphingobium album (ex Liu et al. 2023)]MDE8653148.1 ankyrin repeat domain-containing protein [Novosphingobium album (ex Liu et al. 2023)]
MKALARVVLPVLVGMACLASPAQAQFSDGYKFLDAVRKKEGQKVEDALNEPGTTIINTRDVSNGETALHIVTQRRDLTWLQYLAGRGANVNARDGRGQTPLQIATSLGWREGVEYLVGRKAKLDETNNAGETPLISAVHQRDTALMRILLEAGADPDRADNSGRSARDYAKLDGKGSALLQAIDTYAKKGAKAASQATYGPVF